MSVLDSVAQKTVGHLAKVEGTEGAFDPASIGIFLELIMDLISQIKACKGDAAQGLKMVNNPSFLQRASVRIKVRRNLDRADRKHGANFTEALVATGKDLTIEEMNGLYEEVE